jgi:tRNA pseudouridine38-40 synthase
VRRAFLSSSRGRGRSLPNVFKFTLAYDGTGLVGWQRQASGTSVQGLLEDALADLDGRPVAVAGAGRTDAGVHALGQVASAALERSIDAASLVRALNVRLPLAVRVLEVEAAPGTFHPRFQARAKTYRYRIWNADVISPFERAYAWHILGPPLDVNAMTHAAGYFKGRHDFAAFQGAGTENATTEREIFLSSFRRSTESQSGDAASALLAYDVTGSGFLRHMVRTIVGTLVEVGRGRHPPEWVRDVINSRRREMAGRTAPAEGLFLVSVNYD